MLFLDYKEDLSLQTSSQSNTEDDFSTDTINLDIAVESIHGRSAKVHINTLSTYVAFGGGIYKMTDVKKMTAKEEFLKMSLKDRNCVVESFEDCRTRNLLRACNCVPWEVPGYQVSSNSYR